MEYTDNPVMKPPDYNGALEYARKRLIGELLPVLRYHNLHHSFGEVLPAALLLANQVGVAEDVITAGSARPPVENVRVSGDGVEDGAPVPRTAR